MTQTAKHTPPYDKLAAIIEQIEIVALDWKARAEKAESVNAELLAALKILQLRFNDDDPDAVQARTAIAKAEGR